ncbi:MAG: mandelate racemase/muconate lactonizing enzyme family protein [Oscillospiraceae bacterium]
MKITSIDVFEMKPNVMGKVICLRINTDEGISGFGEVGLSYGKAHDAGVGIAKDYAQLLIGMDPMKIEYIWEHIFRSTFWGMGGGTVINAGMSAVDIALWDIKGKALGVPVWELLGGKTNDKIRAYASQLQFDWDVEHRFLTKPEQYAEATKKAMAQGYTAIKVDPIGVTSDGKWAREATDPNWKMRGKLSSRMVNIAYERTAAMREAGGSDLDIIIELHAYTDSITAVQLGKKLEPLDIYYYEEPVHPLNAGSMLEIHTALNIPIASGERIYTRWGFRDFLEKRAIQVIQPDITITGGISETKKICDMANVYDAAVQAHVCGGPIATAATLQLEAVIPNFLIHEVHEGAIKAEMRELGLYDYQPVDGAYDVPNLPGIGQELSEKAMAEAVCYTFK